MRRRFSTVLRPISRPCATSWRAAGIAAAVGRCPGAGSCRPHVGACFGRATIAGGSWSWSAIFSDPIGPRPIFRFCRPTRKSNWNRPPRPRRWRIWRFCAWKDNLRDRRPAACNWKSTWATISHSARKVTVRFPWAIRIGSSRACARPVNAPR